MIQKLIPKFKASSWSTRLKLSKELIDVGYTVRFTEDKVHLTLLQRKRNGERWQMQLEIDNVIAEELASVLRREDEPKVEPPKRNWFRLRKQDE